MSRVVYVTGKLDVVPGTPRAMEVAAAFKEATAHDKGITIYVLGAMFAYGVPKDDMVVFLDALPGRKVLVVEKSARGRHEMDERALGGWHEVVRYAQVSQWGMKFQLSPDVSSLRFEDGLIIHADDGRSDSQHMLDARWDEWYDRFGPKGLKSLYALGVVAAQYAAGMAAPEPAD